MKKRIVSVLLCLCMTLALLPTVTIPTFAAESVQVGDFLVEGGIRDTDYEWEESRVQGVLLSTRLIVKTATPLTIRNVDFSKVSNSSIVVQSSTGANITLAGVNISPAAYVAACSINGSGDVHITLADGSENILAGHTASAGLYKSNSGALTIDGSGKLTATGSTNAAGIGGDTSTSASNIVINGGTIIATATGNGAGIGGGKGGAGSNITINGGTVIATGAGNGAGIGGGEDGAGSNITITGGTVTATGGEHAAGIGGGMNGAGSNITISGGTVRATGKNGGAGIGGGAKDQANGSPGTDIKITGGTVIATATGSGAGIGGGRQGAGRDITISGGTVTAISKDSGAGIGGGYNGEGTGIVISWGSSVKAIGGPKYQANDIGGGGDKSATIPTNGTENVYLLKLGNTESGEVKIDGGTYPLHNHSAADSNDTTLYVYLTGKDHTISVSGQEIQYTFDATAGTFRTDMQVTLDGWTYGDEPNTPTVKFGGISVRDNLSYQYQGRGTTTYAASATAPTDAGDYTVTATYHHPTDTFTASADFQIGSRDISRAVINVKSQPTYNGAAQKVDFEVTDSAPAWNRENKQLVPNVDYTVLDSSDTATNVNETKRIKIQGKGNYTGTKEADDSWTMGKGVPQADYFDLPQIPNKTYDGTPATVSAPTLKAGTGAGQVTVHYTPTGTFDKTTTPPRNAGTYEVTFDVADGDNYEGATGLLIGTLTISQKDISGANIELTEEPPAYDGTYYTAKYHVTLDGKELLPNTGVFYLGEGITAKDAGSVTLTIIGMDNYSGTASLTWNRPKGEPQQAYFTITTPAPVAYDGNAKTVALPRLAGEIANPGCNFTVYYAGIQGTDYPKTITAPSNVGKYRVTFSMDGSGKNLNATTQEMEIGVLEITDAGHRWDAGVITREPTCTTPGEKTFTCSYGHPSHTKMEPIPALGHSLERTPAKEATVTETGNIEYWHCQNCGKYFSDIDGKHEIDQKDTITPKLPPEIVDGHGQNVTVGENKSLVFRSNAAYSDFLRAEMDGKALNSANYTVEEGSTVVTLKGEYVAGLPVGNYTLGIVSEGGTATSAFTVNAMQTPSQPANSSTKLPPTESSTKLPPTESSTNMPLTGDHIHVYWWLTALLVSGGLLVVVGVRPKKKKGLHQATKRHLHKRISE